MLGVFIVSGLSYLYTPKTFGNHKTAPGHNTFRPINEGSDSQLRCVANDIEKPLRHLYPYTDCNDASPVITNGLIVKNPYGALTIEGDPNSSTTKYRKGGLYVGCTTNTTKSSATVRTACSGSTSGILSEPETYLNGDVVIHALADPNATGDRKICVNYYGIVSLCP
jgi:hypothetical protein